MSSPKKSGIADKWRVWSEKFSKQKKSEKILILVAALSLAVAPLYLNVVDTSLSKAKTYKSKIEEDQSAAAAARMEADGWRERLQQDPAEAAKREIAELEAKIASLQKRVKESFLDLIPAYEIPGVLRDVLSDMHGLRLISISNSSPETIVEYEKERTGLYRHTTVIKFEGGFMDTMRYLQALENLDRKFIWGQIRYSVKDYPKAEVEIEVITISDNKEFIRG